MGEIKFIVIIIVVIRHSLAKIHVYKLICNDNRNFIDLLFHRLWQRDRRLFKYGDCNMVDEYNRCALFQPKKLYISDKVYLHFMKTINNSK